MKNLPNIERSAFRKHEYIGYGGGACWRVVRSTSSYGRWWATPHYHTPVAGTLPQQLYGYRLADISAQLAKL